MDRFIERVRTFLGAWAPLVAFIIISIAGGYAIQQSSQRDAELLYEGLFKSCERQNVRDKASNQRSAVIEEVLNAAATSREKEAEVAKDLASRKINLEVAERYRFLATSIPYINPVQCSDVVPRP